MHDPTRTYEASRLGRLHGRDGAGRRKHQERGQDAEQQRDRRGVSQAVIVAGDVGTGDVAPGS
jgi:hypothetical protein